MTTAVIRFRPPDHGEEGVVITRSTSYGGVSGQLAIQPPNFDYGYVVMQSPNGHELWRTEYFDVPPDNLTPPKINDIERLYLVSAIAPDEAEAIKLHDANLNAKYLWFFNQKILDDIEAVFAEQIRGRWDWDMVIAYAKRNVGEDEDGNVAGRELLGSTLTITPSGKFYMPWSSNITHEEANVDTCFREALEAVAEEKGGWIEDFSGDVFFAIAVEEEEDDESEDS